MFKVRNDLGAVAAFRLVTLVAGLPRTRSGIILGPFHTRLTISKGNTDYLSSHQTDKLEEKNS